MFLDAAQVTLKLATNSLLNQELLAPVLIRLQADLIPKNVFGTLKTCQTDGARPRKLRERHAISNALQAVRARAVKPNRLAPARLWLNVLQRQLRRKSTLGFGNPASTLRAI